MNTPENTEASEGIVSLRKQRTHIQSTRDFISDRAKWCQMAWAKDSANLPVNECDQSACQFCVMGAYYKISGYKTKKIADDSSAYDARIKILRAAEAYNQAQPEEQRHGGIISYNDQSDPDKAHKDVLAILDLALGSINVKIAQLTAAETPNS